MRAMNKTIYVVLVFSCISGIAKGQKKLNPLSSELFEKVLLANNADSVVYGITYRAYASHDSKVVVEEKEAILVRHKENYRLDFGGFVIIQRDGALLQVDEQMQEIIYAPKAQSILSDFNLVPTKSMVEYVNRWKWYEEGKEWVFIAAFENSDAGPFERLEFRVEPSSLFIRKLTLLYRKQASFYFPFAEEETKPRLEVYYTRKAGRAINVEQDFPIQNYLETKPSGVRLLPKWQEYKLRVL